MRHVLVRVQHILTPPPPPSLRQNLDKKTKAVEEAEGLAEEEEVVEMVKENHGEAPRHREVGM